MAVSEVSICNQALGWLGEKPIISFDDASAAAQLCKNNYDLLRDAVQETRDWAFCMVRFKPAPLATPPAWGYSYQFQIPAGVFRLIFVGENDDSNESQPVDGWQREGDKIVANVNTIYVRAVGRVEDTAKFPPLFVQALAARIAADLAMPITNSRSLQSDMFKLFGTKLTEASNSDAVQGRTRIIKSRDLSVTARLSNRAA